MQWNEETKGQNDQHTFEDVEIDFVCGDVSAKTHGELDDTIDRANDQQSHAQVQSIEHFHPFLSAGERVTTARDRPMEMQGDHSETAETNQIDHQTPDQHLTTQIRFAQVSTQWAVRY